MKKKSKKKYFIFTFLLLIIIYLFWGPLFPWSPVKPGFHRIESGRATIFIEEFSKQDSILYDIEEIFTGEEEFHDLEFKDNVKIMILGKESTMKRYLPWMKGEGFSVSLSMVHLIYIGSTARNSEYGYLAYLKHELSHELIRQHTSTENSFEIQEQGWMAEGLATYYGGPKFFNKYEFGELCRMRNIGFNNLIEQNPLKIPEGDFKFVYTYYRYFIEFLIERYGLAELQRYLKLYLKNPADYKNLFSGVYKRNYKKLLVEYRNYLGLEITE